MDAREFIYSDFSDLNQVEDDSTIGYSEKEVIALMESFYRFQVSTISQTFIKENFNRSPNNLIHPDRFKKEGAKLLMEKLCS